MPAAYKYVRTSNRGSWHTPPGAGLTYLDGAEVVAEIYAHTASPGIHCFATLEQAQKHAGRPSMTVIELDYDESDVLAERGGMLRLTRCRVVGPVDTLTADA